MAAFIVDQIGACGGEALDEGGEFAKAPPVQCRTSSRAVSGRNNVCWTHAKPDLRNGPTGVGSRSAQESLAFALSKCYLLVSR